MFDVLIQNGLVVDGSGRAGYTGDIAIKDGFIVEIGEVDGQSKHVIDAKGKVVSPGFIDPHTHFDVQLLWDGAARPALEHGITSIVSGNCSLSLAPLRAEDRPDLVGMFQQIEEMPPEAFTSAFDWTWEDFAGYRTAIEAKLQLNVAPLVGHSAIRQWVMGAAASQRAASLPEIDAMRTVLRECLKDGAIGMSTSYIDVDAKDRPVPSRWAQFSELDALCAVLGEFGRMLQVVPEFYDTDLTIARIDQLAELSIKHTIPTTFSPVFDSPETPNSVPRQIARVEEHAARGARVHPQMQTRPVDMTFSLLRPSFFFIRFPSWYALAKLSLDERLRALADLETVEKLVADTGPDEGVESLGYVIARGGDAIPMGFAGRSLNSIAAERGETPARALISLSLENGLDVAFVAAGLGHSDTSRIGPFLRNPLMHIGASDGGAHLASFATYGDTGYLFSEFVRKSHTFTLEEAVRKITLEAAEIWNIPNRGRLEPGWAADIVVFDADIIARGDELPVFDMPGGGLRYTRKAIGVETVLVNGQIAYANGDYTKATAGVVAV